jgi:hypothetical protein
MGGVCMKENESIKVKRVAWGYQTLKNKLFFCCPWVTLHLFAAHVNCKVSACISAEIESFTWRPNFCAVRAQREVWRIENWPALQIMLRPREKKDFKKKRVSYVGPQRFKSGSVFIFKLMNF